MKKFASSIIAITIIASFQITPFESARAATSFILPNPLFEFMKRPIYDIYVDIWVGAFTPYTPADVNQATILVNSNLVPTSVEITPHAIFEGDALKIKILMTDFLPPYGKFYNSDTEIYIVSGEFNDQTPFTIEGTFISRGLITGDVNSDGEVTVEDMTFIINAIFRGGPLPAFPLTADIDGNCSGPNINDLTYLINSIYRGGPNPTHCPN